jgi:hypothetical protein
MGGSLCTSRGRPNQHVSLKALLYNTIHYSDVLPVVGDSIGFGRLATVRDQGRCDR